MYRSANRFRQRLPAGRFWGEYAPAHQLKAAGSEEVLMDALASAVAGATPWGRMERFSDQEIAGLVVKLGEMGLIKGSLPEKVVADLERRLEREDSNIHFSDNGRILLERLVLYAAGRWRKL